MRKSAFTSLTLGILIIILIVRGNGAPVNKDKLSQEIIDLRRNVSFVWRFLSELKNRMSSLENKEVNHLTLPCDDLLETLSDSQLKLSPHMEAEEEEEEEEDEDDERRKSSGEDDEKRKSSAEDDDDKKSEKDGKKMNVKKETSSENKEKKKCNSSQLKYRNSPIANRHRRDTSIGGWAKVYNRMSSLIYEAFHRWQQQMRTSFRPFTPTRTHSTSGRYFQPYVPTTTPINEMPQNKTNLTAFCSLKANKALPPASRMDVIGKIYLIEKEYNTLVINIKLRGLMPSKSTSTLSQSFKHGLHIHQLGNLNNGCESTGPHFNPFNMTHGGPLSQQRHLGDLGNIETDSLGNLNKTLEFQLEKPLSGPNSFIGKAIVIHEKVDDLGSNPSDVGSMTTGNAGTRLACCVIYKLD